MDQSKNENCQTTEKRLESNEVNDVKLLECSKTISEEISKKHQLNPKKLDKLISKSLKVCQNSSDIDKMFKDDVVNELDSHLNEYKKLEVYQDISKKLDEEIANAFNDIQQMDYNAAEIRSVNKLKVLSDNIKSTEDFLKESKIKIDNIYKRIKKANESSNLSS